MQIGNHSMSVRLVFRGDNLGPAFADFATERLARFALEGRVVETGAEAVTVEAAGHHALVDMLEICCSVGPLQAVVREVRREPV